MRKSVKSLSIISIALIMALSLISCDQGKIKDETINKEQTTVDKEETTNIVKTVTTENIDLGTDKYEAKGKVTAKDDQNNIIWTYESEAYQMSELDMVSDTCKKDNKVFAILAGTLYCFEKESGQVLWKVAECGASQKIVLINNNKLAFTSYYSPNLVIVKYDDEGVVDTEKLDVYPGLSHGYDIEIVGEQLKITYEYYDKEGESNKFFDTGKAKGELGSFIVYTDFAGQILKK